MYSGSYLVFAPDWETVTWNEEERGTGVYWGAPLPESFINYATPPVESVPVAAGAKVPVTIHALRQDGFDGEIAIALKNAPARKDYASPRKPLIPRAVFPTGRRSFRKSASGSPGTGCGESARGV